MEDAQLYTIKPGDLGRTYNLEHQSSTSSRSAELNSGNNHQQKASMGSCQGETSVVLSDCI